MITTGEPKSSGRKTEALDVVSGETCADLAYMPNENWGTVGANLEGTPVACGYRHCFNLDGYGNWQKLTNFNEWRRYAAGVMFKNKFHVFGGHQYDGSGRLQTSEIISIDGGVEYGPELPLAVRYHAITSINSTVSLLSGGFTSSNSRSPRTWYFNHETNVFSSGPSLLQGRNDHGSTTIVDKVTKEKIPMVTGGWNGALMDSTELLINGQWQSGTRGHS